MNHHIRRKLIKKTKRAAKRQTMAIELERLKPIMSLRDLCNAILEEINIKKNEEKMRQTFQEYDSSVCRKFDSLPSIFNPSKLPNKTEQENLIDWQSRLSRRFYAAKLKKIDVEASNPILLDNVLGNISCDFYDKTGSCRYGTSCKKHHFKLYDEEILKFNINQDDLDADSKIVLILRHIYNQRVREEFPDYDDFYRDIRDEISQKYGPIRGLRTCKNLIKHLHGCVYFEFPTLNLAELAFHGLSKRSYCGSLVIPEIVLLKYGWKNAVCGMDHRDKCPRGDRYCHFLHVYLNPNEEKQDLIRSLSKNMISLPKYNSTSNVKNKASKDHYREIEKI